MSGRGATGYDYLRVAEIEAILVDTFKENGFGVIDVHGHPCAYPLLLDDDRCDAIDLHLLARELEARLS